MATTDSQNQHGLTLFKSRGRLVQESLRMTVHKKKHQKLSRMERSVKLFVRILRESFPWILFVLYSASGATAVYEIELSFPLKIFPELGQHESHCLATKGWWGAIYYVTTLYTTIGKCSALSLRYCNVIDRNVTE